MTLSARVVARIRPLSEQERESKSTICLHPKVATTGRYSTAARLQTIQEKGEPSNIDEVTVSSLSRKTPPGRSRSLPTERVEGLGLGEAVRNRRLMTTCLVAQSLTSEKKFEFDAVLPSHASQQEAYEALLPAAWVQKILRDGVDTLILSYGQSGAGKSYTLFGQEVKAPSSSNSTTTRLRNPLIDDGVFVRLLCDIYRFADEAQKQDTLQVKMSCVELLNDEILDLLSPSMTRSSTSESIGNPGASYENSSSTPTAREVPLGSLDHALSLFHQTFNMRRMAQMKQSSWSTFSHLMYTLTIEMSHSTCNGGQNTCDEREIVLQGGTFEANSNYPGTRSVKLMLIDLAGTERIKKPMPQASNQKQSISINTDAFLLGKLVAAVSQSQEPSLFDNCALTKFIRPVMKGSCNMYVMGCLSPLGNDLGESLNTLRFLTRVKTIEHPRPTPAHPTVIITSENSLVCAGNGSLRNQLAVLKNLAKEVMQTNNGVAHDQSNATSETELETIRSSLSASSSRPEGSAEDLLSKAADGKLSDEVRQLKEEMSKITERKAFLESDMQQLSDQLSALRSNCEKAGDGNEVALALLKEIEIKERRYEELTVAVKHLVLMLQKERKQYAKLERCCRILEKAIKVLREENVQLKKENAELRLEVARLSKVRTPSNRESRDDGEGLSSASENSGVKVGPLGEKENSEHSRFWKRYEKENEVETPDSPLTLAKKMYVWRASLKELVKDHSLDNDTKVSMEPPTRSVHVRPYIPGARE